MKALLVLLATTAIAQAQPAPPTGHVLPATPKTVIRQHAHARGAWFEIERLFALTSRAWILSEADVQTLILAGHRPEECALRLQPPRRFFVIEPSELSTLADAREIEVSLSSEIVSASALALVPFD